jgi:N-carbamoyl-L-amino-acid hydrolase
MKTTITNLRQTGGSLFEALRAASADGVGITRDGYGRGETVALELLESFAMSEGLHAERDRAGNLLIGLEAKPARASLLIGSHLDSVPQGGNYDGAAGLVAGLLCLMRLRDEGVKPPAPVGVLCLRGEESVWFGRASLGSSALFGKLAADDLERRKRQSTLTLRDCMKAIGADVDAIAAGEPLILPQSVAGYLELHIEQGAVMVSRELPTAVVPAIRGNVRHNHIRCVGEAAHSGATPRWLRRDAVFAVADLLMRLDEHWRVLLERGLDLVVTAGIVATEPAEHAVSRVPGEATFSLEIRSQSVDTLEGFYRLVQTECASIEAARKVTFAFDRRVDSAPARMHEPIVAGLLELSAMLGLPTERVASGPGHDASVFANNGVPAGMIFVRNQNGSHNPREAMALDDFMRGVELLYAAVRDQPWLRGIV